MQIPLSLFYKYANDDVDRLNKAKRGKIQHKNGTWISITNFDKEYMYSGRERWYWSTLLEYFINIDVDVPLAVEIYEYCEDTCVTKNNDLNCQDFPDNRSTINRLWDLFKEYKFEDADNFYVNQCTKLITPNEYTRYRREFRDSQKSKFISELRCLLEQYKFEDAEKFYQNQYSKFIVISPEEYLREHNLYFFRFRESQKSNLMNELRNLLGQYKFEDAEKFYTNECAKLITSEEYKIERSQYLKGFRESQKSNLMDELRCFLDQYQFENAKSFYHSQCAEFITLVEYQTEHNQYFHRFCNLYRSRLEIVIRENFLDADKVYQEQYKSYIKIKEYNDIKQKFVQNWIKNNLANTPDLEQSLAIGSVNSHVQLIARAGSGKTSTLVNRAIFLQRHCGIKSSAILLLAFNRKAAQEIRERLQKNLQNDPPYAMTFHALAYHLVHPDETLIFDEPEGQQTRSRSLQSVIDEYVRNSDYSEQIKSLMIAKFRKVWIRISEGGYDLTPEEMIEYRRSLPQVGIDGNNYKSGGEKIIADFLFEHDIPFKYEKNFWWRGVNYHPDFTILKEVNGNRGIVIEYFGLQGDPNYDEQSEQKRHYWKEEQSDYLFIELNPAILKPHGREGMENHLHELLVGLGLELNRLSTPEIWEKIKDRAIDEFTQSMTQFIGRCRKQCLTPNQLSEKIERYFASHPQTSEPEFQFLDLAQNFYISYLDRLQQTGEEDFDGLMQRAAKIVDEGNTIFLSSKFRGDLKDLKYIMIDEYQDFSLLFHNLIIAIRKQNPEALFFCVGDNWQAINGFAGADLYYYNNFAQIFKPSHTLPITTNYRSGSQIVIIGNQLMTGKGIPAKPSTQLQGKIQLVNIAKFQMTAIEEKEYGYDDLTAAIIRLTGKLIQDGKQIALLSKTNTLQGVDRKIKKLDEFRKYILKKLNLVGDLEQLIEISTTHKYKGKERQAVIILDAYKYPTIHPSSIFFRIFGDDENNLLEDDRRLFYVALTRAKEELYIVDSFKTSPFIAGLTSKMQLQELDWREYPVPTTETRSITVKVTNQQGRGTNGTFNLRELLRSDGFRWNGTSRSWNKVEPVQKFLADGSRLPYLSDRNWSSQANGIEVNFCNEQEQSLASYVANNGNWSCNFDNFDQSNPNEYDDDDIPF